MNLHLIDMQLEDIAQVTKLAEQLGYPCTIEQMTSRFSFLHKHPDHGLFVVREDARVLGWVHVNRDSASLLSEPRAEITALVVDESERGKKIGILLLQKAEAWAKSQGLSLVRLRSNIKRTDAHRFYLRENYKIQKTWHLFVKELS